MDILDRDKRPETFFDYIVALYPEIRNAADGVYVHDPITLFVVLGHFLSEDALISICEYAIDDGYGDPEDLDPHDDRQRMRLEEGVLDALSERVVITELMTLELMDFANETEEIGLFLAEIEGIAILALYDSRLTVSYQAIAFGPAERLLQSAGADPDGFFQRVFGFECLQVTRIVMRHDLAWAADVPRKIANCLIGPDVLHCEIIGDRRLAGQGQSTAPPRICRCLARLQNLNSNQMP